MAVWIPWARVLVAGDYLSPVEIPMLVAGRARPAPTWRRSARLEPLVEQAEYVVPGHGAPLDGQRAAAILREDRAYVEALLRRAARRRSCRSRGGRPRRRRSTPRTRRGSRRERAGESPHVGDAPLTPELRALGEAILDAALERLAADPPALGRRAAAGGGRRARGRGDHAGGARAGRGAGALPRRAAAADHRDRPPALPRVHPLCADAGLGAVRPAGQRPLDLRRLVAGGRRRGPRRERGAALAGRSRGPAGRRGRLLRPGRHVRQPLRAARRPRARPPRRGGDAPRALAWPAARRSTRRCARPRGSWTSTCSPCRPMPTAACAATRCARRSRTTASSPSSPRRARRTSG